MAMIRAVLQKLKRRYPNWRDMKTEAQQEKLMEELMDQLVPEGGWEVRKNASGRKEYRQIIIKHKH